MPGVKCCVFGCRNSYYRNNVGQDGHLMFSMYCFPKDAKLRKVWMKRLRLKQDPGSARVCVTHFSEEQFELDMEAKIMGIRRARKLKLGAVPNRRISRSLTPENKKALAEGRKSRLENRSLKKDIKNLISIQSMKTKRKKRRSLICSAILETDSFSNIDLFPPFLDNTHHDYRMVSGVSETLETEDIDDCLRAVGLIAKDKSVADKEGLNHNLSQEEMNRSENSECNSPIDYIQSEMEKMFSTPLNEGIEERCRDFESSVINTPIPCSNCETHLQENRKLKLQLAFFKSKLSHIVDIYHKAEETALNHAKTEYERQLVKYKKANAELNIDNNRYVNILRSILPKEDFHEQIYNQRDRRYWSPREMENAQKLNDICPEAFEHVKTNMNIDLPELSQV